MFQYGRLCLFVLGLMYFDNERFERFDGHFDDLTIVIKFLMYDLFQYVGFIFDISVFGFDCHFDDLTIVIKFLMYDLFQYVGFIFDISAFGFFLFFLIDKK
eukprot:TRINITY_DN9800_c0_g1_i18.p2 TRINITY_DN9800_c0_g1~~TRINITY_DN9800_c0_g1_i18.p2  ORF type:complete len:101 (-),score=8.46 TRINITY_DN9800_c0_g1_i18:275-577(-)